MKTVDLAIVYISNISLQTLKSIDIYRYDTAYLAGIAERLNVDVIKSKREKGRTITATCIW